MTIVTCNGCFDGLHSGHIFFLKHCMIQGDVLIVGINNDDYIRRHKKTNLVSQEERKNALIRLGFIQEVYIFDEEDPCKFIERIKPDIHCIGEEYRGRAIEEPTCERLGIRIVYVPRVGKWSTTALKNSGQYEHVSAFGCKG